ncbi:MAG TPA: aldolase/citrate lyase family protein [Bauldia sp.]|nr:aldolase/citrate lyase family protein [Bauldia sp.]
MTKNVVKAAAASGDLIRGVHLTFPAPVVIEVLARSAGLHFVYIDGEHGRFDWHDVEIACVTAERCGLTPIARVFDRQISTITRFLDRGVVGIVAPHVETVADAQEVIDAAYFAPIGKRSFGSGRPEYGTEIGDRRAYIADCNERVSVCLMIESRRGLDNVTQMAALPGIDYFSFGLMDLAQDLGHPGNPEHPDVRAAFLDASARIRAAGKRVREDFMNYCWINDVLMVGAQHALGQKADGGGRPDMIRAEAKRAAEDGMRLSSAALRP